MQTWLGSMRSGSTENNRRRKSCGAGRAVIAAAGARVFEVPVRVLVKCALVTDLLRVGAAAYVSMPARSGLSVQNVERTDYAP